MKRRVASEVVNRSRVRALVKGEIERGNKGPIVYWMSRDQRARDNWALLYAQELATANACPLVVCFNLLSSFLGAPIRHFHFMLHGLAEVEKELRAHNIDFVLLRGDPVQTLPEYLRRVSACAVISDFSPLRINRKWKEELTKVITIPFHEVDAHNVVPAWLASAQQETAARTIRPKLWDKSKHYFDEFPALERHGFGAVDAADLQVRVDDLLAQLEVDRSVAPVTWATPGPAAGDAALKAFLQKGLDGYEDRNKIAKNATSNLSPWLHYGNLSAQRCIMEAMKAKKEKPNAKRTEAADGFIEEIFIRRELAENFCLYNPNYDSLAGAAQWARDTLKDHENDKREFVYTSEQLEAGKTHDKLWNAAQLEMVRKGKMQGFMRMYWCKKILEWTVSPAEALRIAIYLNDKYELDGRDPNGYVGCMWSICGVHDQGFGERPVFGKIRFMNYDGCVRKNKKEGVEQYIRYVDKLK